MVTAKYVKLVEGGNVFIIECHNDGSLAEYSPFDPQHKWHGRWFYDPDDWNWSNQSLVIEVAGQQARLRDGHGQQSDGHEVQLLALRDHFSRPQAQNASHGTDEAGEAHELEKFVLDILVEKDVSGLDDKTLVELSQLLIRRLEDQIHAKLISQLESPDLDELERFLNENDGDLEGFLYAKGVDVQGSTVAAMLEFRRSYLAESGCQ